MGDEIILPTIKRCNLIYEKLYTPKNVINHSVLVSKISVLIAKLINKTNDKFKINVDLVKKASLLHDCFKFLEFSEVNDSTLNENNDKKIIVWQKFKKQFSNLNHCMAGFEFFKDDYYELALIIKKHDYKSIISDDESNRPITIEEKIVSYADKRVMHSKIVSLEKRFLEGLNRWKLKFNKDVDFNLIKQINEAYFNLEYELFNLIDLDKIEIEKKINALTL
ncbi:MAG: HD domain-containing protein [Candidatus Woesearchaeota archaeon]